MIQPQQLRYQSYLLRCWEEADETAELIIWRFSLQDPRSGERRGFTNLTELIIALQDELMAEEQTTGSRK